jgi:hypothetical protein
MSLIAFSALLVLCCTAGSERLGRAQEKAPITTIAGTTLQWLGGKKYAPIDRVNVVVSRGGGVVANPDAKGKGMGWVSAGRGKFEIKIRGGEPVVVLFHFNEKYVPQVQMLSAQPGQRHSISPALIAVKDYLAMEAKGESPVPLRTLMAAAARAVPRDCDDELAKKLRKDFTTILRSVPEKTSLLVPAYFDPAIRTGRAYWAVLERAAKQVPIVAIVNPNSGPGSATEQRVYLPVLRSARRAGVTLIGYVFTDHGKKPLETATREVTAWKRLYGGLVSGIFLDAQAAGKESLPYYRALARHIRKEFAPAPLIIGNPGTKFDEEYLHDVVNSAACFYENSTATKRTQLSVPEFFALGNWPRACLLAHKVTDRRDMESLVRDLMREEIGYLYVTDAHMSDGVLNPWSRLPSYWKEEVEAVARSNKEAREELLPPR